MNKKSFLKSVEKMTTQERKVLLKQIRGKLKVLDNNRITKNHIERELQRADLAAQTNRLQQKLYYILHKPEINKNRKLYKRTRN
jgi:hypothetical protein